MKFRNKYSSLYLIIFCTIAYIIYNVIFLPRFEKERRDEYLNESFEGIIVDEFIDINNRHKRYLILDDGKSLNMNNQYYQNTIKIGQNIKKESGDSLLYINKMRCNYFKEND